MIEDIGRRTFLRRAGQVGGLIVAGGAIESFLAACGGNVGAPATTVPSPGTTPIGNGGFMTPGKMMWGADYVGGAPYVFKDPTNPNNLIGFEVEIASAMAGLMGLTADQTEICYSQLDQALLSNKFDFVMNGWEKRIDRDRVEYYSDPYYHYGLQVVVRNDDTRFTQFTDSSTLVIQDLEGYKVGTIANAKSQFYLQQDPQITTVGYNGNLPFDDLKQKRLDAVLTDVPIAVYYVLGQGPTATPDPKLRTVGKPLLYDDYIIGFNKKNPNATTVLKEVNQALAVLKKNGTLKQIYQKWALWNSQQAQIGIM